MSVSEIAFQMTNNNKMNISVFEFDSELRSDKRNKSIHKCSSSLVPDKWFLCDTERKINTFLEQISNQIQVEKKNAKNIIRNIAITIAK